MSASASAVASPTFGMPSANRNRASVVSLDSGRSPRRGSPHSFRPCARARRADRPSGRRDPPHRERGPRRPAGRRPCRRDPRCPSPGGSRSAAATACAAPGRRARPCSARPPRPSTRRTSEPQTGQWLRQLGHVRVRRSPLGMTRTTSGITSPARRMITASPTRTSLRCSSSTLCSVALLTVTPPTNTGSRRATGVSAPVRPTCHSMPRTVVISSSAGNLCAIAQRGARATKPSSLLLRRASRPCRRRHRCGTAARRAGRRSRGSSRAARRRRSTTRDLAARAQPQRAQRREQLAVPRRQAAALDDADAVEEHLERPRRGDARIELAQAPAAALRGLTKVFSPRSSASRFMRSKPCSDMNTSPRASSSRGRRGRAGAAARS